MPKLLPLHKFFPSDEYVGVMLDIETLGLKSWKHAISSFSATKFDLKDGDIKDSLHLRILTSDLPATSMCEKTLQWRTENKVDEYEKPIKLVRARQAFCNLWDFLRSGNDESTKPVIFTNHTEFDIPFLQRHLDSHSKSIPWNHKHVFDVGSLLLGRGVSKSEMYEEVLNSESWHEKKDSLFSGRDWKHDAFYDTVLQIEVLMQGLNQGE